MFTLPTLITITAPTCAGKNFLLKGLHDHFAFKPIVGTTDRAPRADEVEGVDYYFLTTEQSKALEETGGFTELVTYNGTRYGITNEEMDKHYLPGAPTPMVILEPNGVAEYRKLCQGRGIQLFTIFISVSEVVRVQRLNKRTASDIMRLTFDNDAEERLVRELAVHSKRLQAICDKERSWQATNTWDAVVPGDDLSKALEMIEAGILNRNHRTDIYA